jgi:hypothetical protein
MELSLLESSVMTKAKFKELVDKLKPYKLSMKDPPPETVKEFRDVCRQLKGVGRDKLIMEPRPHLPSGTTGWYA